jgi:hypothetical protein
VPVARGAVSVAAPDAVFPAASALAFVRTALPSFTVVTDLALRAFPLFLVVIVTLTLAPGATVDGALMRETTRSGDRFAASALVASRAKITQHRNKRMRRTLRSVPCPAVAARLPR